MKRCIICAARLLLLTTAISLLCSCAADDNKTPDPIPPPPESTEDNGPVSTPAPSPTPTPTPAPSPTQTQKPPPSPIPKPTPSATPTPSQTPSPTPDAPREYPQPDKMAYITIDDGPTRAITPRILDILRDEGIHATFFVLPHSNVDDLYQRILDEGHVIGNHSYSHRYKPLYAEDTTFFRDDLLQMHCFLYDMLGYTATLYRFPGGAMSRKRDVIEPRAAILEEYGYTYFDWNSSTGDADATGENHGPAVLVSNVLGKTNSRRQLIVLMHDSQGKYDTVEALPRIISGLREQGYAFDTLDNYYG